jgi:hypothetical protein
MEEKQTRYCAEIVRSGGTEYVYGLLEVEVVGNIVVLFGSDFVSYIAMNGEITVNITEQDT